MTRHLIYIYNTIISAALLLLLFSCSTEKYVEDGELLLKKTSVVSDSKMVKSFNLQQYQRQRPNTKWLSSMKVPLATYSLSGRDSTKWINRMLRKFGEPPVLLDTIQMQRTVQDMTYALYNNGYLNAEVKPYVDVKGKKASVYYAAKLGEPYVIRGVEYDIRDSLIADLLTEKQLQLHSGQLFSVKLLNDERKQITSYLQNNGYYQFNKEFINYDIDSSNVDRSVYLTMHLNKYRRNNLSPLTDHPCYTVRSIKYDVPAEGRVKLRRRVVSDNTAIKVGEKFNASALQRTYNNFSRLQAVRYTSVHFVEDQDSNLLDCHIQLSRQRANSLQFQPEGTNTAGDLGAAASLTYTNRNMFRGSEVFSVTGRAAYEAISGLEGYQDADYVEYSVESSLTFPRLLFPFIADRKFHVLNATSELTVNYGLQNRPEFHRRSFNAAWRYKWTGSDKRSQYKVDVLDVNYLWMPWISETFKHDYIDSVSNRNVILRYNYEDLLIMKIGFGYTWSNDGNSFRFNVETAGNVLNLLSKPCRFKQNEEGDYTFLGIAYAQYLKGDFDYTRNIRIDDRNSLVLHGRLGVAYPYGNSTILPFEKRYFSGGANSLRGWSVRSLGPGRYRGKDGRIDFINQTGDIRLDLNAEMRTSLFWKFQGAVFVDAGNIWTIRDYAEQPGGKFEFETFWQQLAASYGLGIRLNFDYFVVRFDMGMKAVNPAYDNERQHFPVFHPNLSRDFAFHFAVGMPF